MNPAGEPEAWLVMLPEPAQVSLHVAALLALALLAASRSGRRIRAL